jgi:hypothetical protein
MRIEDGRGTGQEAGVSITGNRLDVSSRADERIYYISRDNGDAYSAYSTDASPGNGEHPFYFKNTSTTQKFYVQSIELSAIAVATFKLWEVSGTGSGSAITPHNLNLTSANVAACTCLGNGDVSGLTEVATIATAICPAGGTVELPLHDALILGQNDAIAIEADAVSASAIHITVLGFFDVE